MVAPSPPVVIQCGKCGSPVSVPNAGMVATCSYSRHPNQAPGDIPFRPPQYKRPLLPRLVIPMGWIVYAILAVIVVGTAVLAFALTHSGFSAGFYFGVYPTARPAMGTTPLRSTGHTTLANPGTVVGERAATAFAPECRGYVPAAPHLALDVANYQYVSLTTTSSVDLTMVLRDPDGHVHCDDDSGEGHNPRITTLLSPGRWTVWVGTFHENAHADFTLLLDARGTTAHPDATGLAPDAALSQGILDLDRTPVGGSITDLSGMVSGAALATDCRGWFTTAPQFAITTAPSTSVDMYPSTHTSTFVAIRAPNGLIQCSQRTSRIPTVLCG